MPWCLRCNIEYSDGTITCPNCKETLTDSLNNTVNELSSCELAQLEEKAAAIRLVKYLNYSGIDKADIITDSESNCYRILIAQSEKNSAMKHYKAFLEVEEELSLQATTKEVSTEDSDKAELLIDENSSTSDDDPSDYDVNVREDGDLTDSEVYIRDDADSSDSDADIQEDYPSTSDEESETDFEDESDDLDEDLGDLEDFSQDDSEDIQNDFEDYQNYFEDKKNDSKDNQEIEKSSSSGSAYVLKKDAYKEHRSSAFMFFVFSIGGLIFLGLNLAGIIQFINGLFSYLVMGAMFVAFFLLGIYSLRKAQEIFTGIDAENEMTLKINSYLASLGDISSIDEGDWSGFNDEVLYFKRTAKLKQMVIQKFGVQNEAYLDVIIEEFYNQNV